MEAVREQWISVVLCKAGGHRLAFDAAQVVSVEQWNAGRAIPHASRAFLAGPPAASGKAVLGNAGSGVGVDSLEVSPERVAVLPAGPLCDGGAGGSLLGFASVRDELWPLVSLDQFARYLGERR